MNTRIFSSILLTALIAGTPINSTAMKPDDKASWVGAAGAAVGIYAAGAAIVGAPIVIPVACIGASIVGFAKQEQIENELANPQLSIEFRDPFTHKKACYTLNDKWEWKNGDWVKKPNDVKDFLEGKNFIIAWRGRYPAQENICIAKKCLADALPALRRKLGMPTDNRTGQRYTLSSPFNIVNHNYEIENPKAANIAIIESNLEEFRSHFLHLRKLAILSHGEPNAPRNPDDFIIPLKNIMAHQIYASIYAYTSPLVEQLNKTQAERDLEMQKFAQERAVRNQLQIDLNQTREEKNQAHANFAQERIIRNQLQVNFNQEQEQRQKALADLASKTQVCNTFIQMYDQANIDLNQERAQHHQTRTDLESRNQSVQTAYNLEAESTQLAANLVFLTQHNLEQERQQHHATQHALEIAREQIYEHADQLLEPYRNRVVRLANLNNLTTQALEQEREQHNTEKENLRRQMAQQNEQSAQDYAAIRIQLSPLRTRANEVSPLRRQVKEKDDEIRELRKLLASRPSYAAIARGDNLPK